MDKIHLLRTRREKLLASGSEIRKQISALVDESSFVELDAYSFSHNDFYGEDAQGEGVVTGYATIDDTPVYIVAQNVKVLSGGVSMANCKKIVKCLDKAAQSGYPVIYLLDSMGVQVGEGVNVLEGMAEVLACAVDLKGEITQITVALGKVYGSFALLCANADYNFMLPASCVSYASPLVISATSGKNVASDEVGGAKSSKYNDLTTFSVESLDAVKENIVKIFSILPAFSQVIEDTEDDLNRVSANLNDNVCHKCLISAVFDDGKCLEMNKDFCPEVVTAIGRIGGISVATLIFAGEEKGVELNLNNVTKIKDFVYFANENGLPLVTFVNTVGIKADLETSNSPILMEVCHLIGALRQSVGLSVVYGKAIGLGYTLFASKSMGANYVYAFANSEVALFSGANASAHFGEVREDKLDEFAQKYAEENADPINAAKNGYVDNVIEPQFVRAYVISALQMLVR
ncbi:MAG: hypothetical protein IJW64_04715 [Clostridia bacterium]|nr:hypothetical protein [Clostridia bacterium]